jgi:hypothetical protein
MAKALRTPVTAQTPVPINAGKQTYLLPISNGIIEHREKIGSAIWLFMLLIDWITSEENGVGKVLGGKPVKLRDLMEALHLKGRQVSSQLQRLKAGGYIRLRRTSYGYSIEVMKSKKFINRDRQKVAGLHRSDPQQIADLDQQKTADHMPQISNNLPNRSAISCRNKEDITVDPTEELKAKPSLCKNADPRVKEFIDWFAGKYRERFCQSYYVRGGKDGKLVKDLLRSFDLPELKERALRLWESDDRFIAGTDRGIGILASQINKLGHMQRSTGLDGGYVR